jgi:peptidoglycan/LPS O-acetylase OafA/YrhL
MKDSPNLDLLRSCAVCLVVFSHFGLNVGWGRSFDIELLGRVGVAIFFVHTSLVLMQSLERQGGAAAPFFIRRFLRIYPLSVSIVVLMAVGASLGGHSVDGWMLLSNLLLIQNLTGTSSVLGPLWSLPYEVQMYLLLPALFAWTQVSGALRVMLLLVGAVIVLTVAQALAGGWEVLQFLPCFLPGVLAYVLPARSTRSPALLFGIAAAGAVAVPALVAGGAPQVPLLWGLCLALGFAIPACRQIPDGALAHGAKVVATYSYSIYLTHILALFFALGLSLGLAGTLAVFLAVQFAMARVCYRWIEKPGILLGQELARRLALKQPIRTGPEAG